MKASAGTISVGEMRSQAQFQSNIPVPDGSGGFTDAWTTFYTCRGRLRQMTGRRGLEQSELVQTREYELIVRYTTTLNAVTATTRVLIGTDNYAVKTFELVDQIEHWYQFTLVKNNS